MPAALSRARRAVLSAPARGDCRGDRHQRQDLGCRIRPANLGCRRYHAAASVGTIGVVTPRREVYGSLTTPDPVALHRTLSELAGEGITHLAIEASSHGLDQHRLDGVRIAAGAFTNLSRDHLDYHPSIEAYLAWQAAAVRSAGVRGRRRGDRCRS
jgi:hypothetical protein